MAECRVSRLCRVPDCSKLLTFEKSGAMPVVKIDHPLSRKRYYLENESQAGRSSYDSMPNLRR